MPSRFRHEVLEPRLSSESEVVEVTEEAETGLIVYQWRFKRVAGKTLVFVERYQPKHEEVATDVGVPDRLIDYIIASKLAMLVEDYEGAIHGQTFLGGRD